MNFMRMSLKNLAIAALVVTAAPYAGSAQAQDPSMMGCNELWYARNQIYAQFGYCFRTARSQSVFGPGCFAPYGRLPAWAQRRVNEFQMWEDRNGCAR
jgi:hypothetical protein